MKLERIFSNSEEKFVKNYKIYGKKADGKLYYDSDFTSGNLVTKEDAINAFNKGVVIVYDGATYVPTCLTVTTAKATLTIVTVGAQDAFTPVDLVSASVS